MLRKIILLGLDRGSGMVKFLSPSIPVLERLNKFIKSKNRLLYWTGLDDNLLPAGEYMSPQNLLVFFQIAITIANSTTQ